MSGPGTRSDRRTVVERMDAGRALRDVVPRSSHAGFSRRAHARSGDAAGIAGYIGSSGTFGKAMLAFADAYADQTEHDHARLVEAITDGVIPAEEGI